MTQASVERMFGLSNVTSKEDEFRRGIKKISSDLEELFNAPVIDVTFIEWHKGNLSKVEKFLPEATIQQADFFSHEAVIACFNLGRNNISKMSHRGIQGVMQSCGIHAYTSFMLEDVFGEIHILARFNL